MNKIIQINLSGQAISIDEKAYLELGKYLEELQRFFSNNQSHKEIMEDIKARIAEIFISKLDHGFPFITQRDVNDAIQLMGKPSEIEDKDHENNNKYESKSFNKKLFRDVDNRIVAGVCSGIGTYFETDPTIIRLIFVLLILFGGLPILLYLILYFIVPEAKSEIDRNRMYGKPSNISEIMEDLQKKAKAASVNILNEADKISNNLKEKANIKSASKSLLKMIEYTFKIIAKIISGIGSTFFLVIALLITLSIVTNSVGYINIGSEEYNFQSLVLIDNYILSLIFRISLLGLFLIPLGSICFILIRFMFDRKTEINSKKLIVFWILCLITFIMASLFVIIDLNVNIMNDIFNFNKVTATNYTLVSPCLY
jgi:phage shock protein PspC (stress-responsive transcriptional regulator)